MLIKDPDVQPIFRMYIENILATSELKILKRLAAIETLLGFDDFSLSMGFLCWLFSKFHYHLTL